MAESSSSVEESSEEEEHDEVSPNLHSPASPTAAASKASEKKPGLFSERGYLKTLSRQERRRIKREIKKGRKLALTVNNITNALAGVKWEIIGKDILGLHRSKYDEISLQSTDEERAVAVVREWLLRDPLASWRRLINELYLWNEVNRADSILHYAEELTDTSLTHSSLTKVLSSVETDDLWDRLNIPGPVSTRIDDDCGGDEEQIREQHIHYYITCSPYALLGWSHVAGRLHYREEETAERTAKYYVQRVPELSLVLDNLNTVMESISEKSLDDEYGEDVVVVAWLHIPWHKQKELQQQYPVVAQRKRAYSAYYLAHHPGPTWRIIATALYNLEEHGALEVVQKLYLKGTSESRRLFELSMKQGYVDAFVDKMTFYGSAGVGKTCTMSIVAGEDPPDVRNSTPIATRPVTIYHMHAMGGKWHKYQSKERKHICANISKHVFGKEQIEILAASRKENVAYSSTNSEENSDSEERPPIPKRAKQQIDPTKQHNKHTPQRQIPAAVSQGSVDAEVLQVIHDVLDEMFQLIDKCPDTVEPISYIHKLLISDCGGQPQFHEVLPIFLKKLSMIVFVFKLSDNLSSRPMIEYYEEGKPLGTPYKSDHTTEQLIQQGLQSLHTHRSSKDKGGDSPKIIVLGTHKDQEHKCDESRATKNRKLRDMMLPTFKKEIIYYEPGTGQILFPMNAKTPGRKEEDIAQAIRSKFSRENRSDKRQLPLQWVALEIMLEEITQKLKRGILSRNECLEVARRLHLDESALDAALIYLDELSLIFYYSDILPEVVFTNPQVLLDKISELVKVHHDKVQKFSGDDWQDFFCHALVTIDFLAQVVFKKHYVRGLFEPEHLVLLYRKLLIFADFSEGKFFVPSLLRMLSNQEILDQRLPLDSLVAPLVLHFTDGPPRRGVFCALVSFLTSPDNYFPGPWELMMPARSVTPTCLHRNCIQFMIPCINTPCAVTLIDTLLQFEVHFDIASTQSASKLCPTIKDAIITGLRKANIALGYTDSTPSFALLCPCGEGDPHPATIGDGMWKCSLNSRVGKELSPNQLFWDSTSEENICPGIPTSSSSGDSDPSHHKPTLHHHNNGHSAGAAVSDGVSSAAAELTLQDVAAHAGIKSVDILDQECSQQVLLCLAKHCVDWQLIGFHLELTKADIVAVDGDCRSVDEKRVGMLGRWKEKVAFKATYRVFLDTLLSCGKASDAIEACKVIASSVEKPADVQLTFNSSMSEEDFFMWLRSRGINEKDCNTLSENGITPSGFTQFDPEDFDDIGLTKFGKKLILKALAEVS